MKSYVRYKSWQGVVLENNQQQIGTMHPNATRSSSYHPEAIYKRVDHLILMELPFDLRNKL